MLVRAARRKVHSDGIRSRLSCEQLYLPWLCPAFNIVHRKRQSTLTVDSASQGLGPRKRRNSKDGFKTTSRRSLATAITKPFDDIPFVNVPPSILSSNYSNALPISNLRPFDEEHPLQLGEALSPALPRIRMNKHAVGGDLSEILSIYRACLAVGRMERAGIILKRIAKLDSLSSEHILSLHNEYLRVGVLQILGKPSASTTQALHKWFELEIRNQALPIDAETLGYMLKISLQSRGEADRRARLVRRYMDIAKQKDLGLEVLGLDMLSAEELSQITLFCPEYNTEGPEFLEESNTAAPDEVGHAEQEKLLLERPTPQVRPVEQKGLGLKSLRQTLSLFLESPGSDKSISRTLDNKREAQMLLESNAVSSAIERWREESVSLTKMGLNTALQTKSLGARMWRWQIALEAALKIELAKIDEAELKEKRQVADTERCLYGPFLRLLPPDQMAAVTILSCMTTLSSIGIDKGIPLSTAIMAIAENVEDEALFEAIQKTSAKPSWVKSKRDDKSRMTPAILRQAKRSRASLPRTTVEGQSSSNDTMKTVISEKSWPSSIKAKIGAFLMSALIETAKIPVIMEHQQTGEMVTQMQPAFSHSQQFKQGKRIGVILANSVLTKQLKREPVHSLLAKHLPMLVQPDPWTHFNKGGFISHPAKMMRIKLGDKDQRHYAEAAISKGDMDQTFKGLDVLGKTSWRINPPLFDTMLEAWNSGEAIANLAPETPKLSIPPEPDSMQDPIERKKWIRAVKTMENTKSGLHSQRCFQNFQLEIARALRNEKFYFPHNVDFRGRAYPIPPYLNHMGADHCRGLLMFGEGRELGEAGLKWLKIHLANVFGFDKASLKEREDFAMKHVSKIYECATNPLGGSRWWLNAEDPWQFLAACMELKKALDSPDPTKFISHLPIHQDGTCNGLQHYAALGGDSWGAKQVNLEPGDRPADVYSAVANLVKESIAVDKEKGNPYAEVLDGKITRKIVKQTVMTNVYGVTYIGAKAQVRKALVATYKDLPNDERMHPGVLASYIATKIFTALATMFRGAHDIQYWLGECASRISQSITPEQMDQMEQNLSPATGSKSSVKSDPISFESSLQFKSSVIWTNPLHMPIVQPYRTSKSKIVMTNMQRISITEPHRSDPVSKRKQLQGFPPNFIHSLDATHMLLSALRCDELGLSFAAVHDSFWTHAADVESMNTVLRDTFIRIHSEDVIGRLAAEFAARYKGCMYLAKVRHGTVLYNKIQSLRKAQGKGKRKGSPTGKLAELLAERKRYRLLNSNDPKEVEEGRGMTTPGSLYEEFSADGDLAPEDGLSALGIGEISTREARLSMDQELDVGDTANIEEINNPLPGGTPSDIALSNNIDQSLDMDGGAEWAEREPDVTPFERGLAPGSRKKAAYQYDWVWLPLTFPPVPKKVRYRSFRYI